MKNEATSARQARMKAAQRLISPAHEAPAADTSPLKAGPPPPMRARRMVQPVEIVVKAVPA